MFSQNENPLKLCDFAPILAQSLHGISMLTARWDGPWHLGLGFSMLSHRYMNSHLEIRWVGSWRCGCLVTWFCYQLMAKPGNKNTTPSWPRPDDSKIVWSPPCAVNDHLMNTRGIPKPWKPWVVMMPTLLSVLSQQVVVTIPMLLPVMTTLGFVIQMTSYLHIEVTAVAYFTKKVDSGLVKPPFNFNGFARLGLTSSLKSAFLLLLVVS